MISLETGTENPCIGGRKKNLFMVLMMITPNRPDMPFLVPRRSYFLCAFVLFIIFNFTKRLNQADNWIFC